MARGIFNVLQVDSARVRFYEPEDLHELWKIQRDIFNDLIIEGSPWAAPENADHTKARLAVALLECADTGERDQERLKRHALVALDDVSGRTARSGHRPANVPKLRSPTNRSAEPRPASESHGSPASVPSRVG
jgi:hypothetical protein